MAAIPFVVVVVVNGGVVVVVVVVATPASDVGKSKLEYFKTGPSKIQDKTFM